MYDFNLSPEDIVKFSDWRGTLPKAETGACGGRYTFSFTPTSIGTVVKIEDGISGEVLDLTDYDW